MHGFAIVGDTGWEERGDGNGYVEYHGARFLAALSLAAIRAADAWMGDVGSVVRVACDIGIIDNLQFEPWFSPAAWPCGDSHSSRCFALHVLLWRLLPPPAAGLHAVVGSAQPNERDWGVSFNRYGDSQRASPHWRRGRLPYERQHRGRDGPGQRDCCCGSQ